jgi:hypothetical protein
MQAHRSLVLKTAPATQIVATSLMKTYLGVDDAADDVVIQEAIIASRQAIENYTGRSFINTVWNLWLDNWPRGKGGDYPEGSFDLPINAFDDTKIFIDVPRPPLVSVASVTYYNTSNVSAVFSSASYFVDSKSTPGRIVLNSGSSWPSVLLRPANGIDIEFTAGYGTAVTDVPDAIILAHKQMTKFNYRVMTGAYEQGETPVFASDQNKTGLTDFVEKLLMPYRIARF